MNSLEEKGMFANLSTEAVEWLTSGLTSILNKFENKSVFKGKTINFIYPISSV